MEECIENSSEPTIAEEAHGPTAVEAIPIDRPIIAGRIGGLTFTVLDEVTVLLFEPGGPVDSASQLARLDDRVLRGRIGNAARMHFQHHYIWDVITDKHDRRLFGPTIREHLER